MKSLKYFFNKCELYTRTIKRLVSKFPGLGSRVSEAELELFRVLWLRLAKNFFFWCNLSGTSSFLLYGVTFTLPPSPRKKKSTVPECTTAHVSYFSVFRGRVLGLFWIIIAIKRKIFNFRRLKVDPRKFFLHTPRIKKAVAQ